LGNEAETYAELILVNNWVNPEHDRDKGVWVKTQFMIEANTSNSASYAKFPQEPGNDMFRLREAFAHMDEYFAVAPVIVYQSTRTGKPGGGWSEWLSCGARPQVFLSELFSVAFEAGLDYTHSSDGQYAGWLRKFTLAPQLGAGRKFFSRPVLRLFATYANWSDRLRGLVGGAPFKNDTNGLTYGVHAEAWWSGARRSRATHRKKLQRSSHRWQRRPPHGRTIELEAIAGTEVVVRHQQPLGDALFADV